MTPATPRTPPAIRGPWDWPRLRAAIEQARGRRLLLAPAELPSGRSCLWIATSDIDLIVYPRAAGQAEQLHAIAHQAAHILLGHQASASDATPSLFPHLDPALVTAVLAISRYSPSDEAIADELASQVVARTRAAMPRERARRSMG